MNKEQAESRAHLAASRLFAKVYGCLVGGAIGDALGGPVEGWTPTQIRETYGVLDRFAPYRRGPSYHAHFGEGERIGAYTDDTRLKHLLCRAIIAAQGMPRAGDFGHVLAHAYHHAPDALTAGFIEEYYLKAIWGRDKVIYSGEPTNGAIMANSRRRCAGRRLPRRRCNPAGMDRDRDCGES